MKKISTYLRAFLSLGSLGLVILLMALAVFMGAFSQSSGPFDAVVERMYVLGELESEVALDLAEKQVQEALELFSLAYGVDSTGAAEKATQAEERITATLNELDSNDSFSGEYDYSTELREHIADFNQLRIDHRARFETMFDSASEMSDEELSDTYISLREGNDILTNTLQVAIIAIEQDRQAALSDFPDDVNTSIFIIVIAIVLTFILALFGYQAIASAVRPLAHLQNTIATIAGDLYRPGKTRAGGISNEFAKALEELAQAEQARNQAAKHEIETLRQQLYESRRRRLKIYQPGSKTE